MRSLWTGLVGCWLSPRVLAESTGTWLRAGIVCLGLAIATAEGHGLDVLPWAVLVFMVDLAVGRLLAVPAAIDRRHEAFALLLVGAACAGAVLWIANASAGAFSLLLVPAFRAGEAFGRLAALLTVALGAGVGMLVTASRIQLDAAYLTSATLWCGLALMIGVLGAWSSYLRSQRPTAEATQWAAREAAVLLRRLDSLAGSIDGGFDAPATAELLLDAVKATVPGSSRMAVLVGVGSEPAVPLALRGIDRLPWPDPRTADCVLGRVWRTGVAEAGLWTSEYGNRAMAAAPLHDQDGARIGVVVTDRIPAAPFAAEELHALADLVEAHSANVDVALIFTVLRQRAAFEERARLAREMHDGIAQELVALGYRIDVARRQASTPSPQLALALDAVRVDLSRVLTDLRLRIGDLRLAVHPDQGLGAVVGARLQQFGAMTGLTVGLRLSESSYRLPAHLESLIYRLILDVLSDARHAYGISAIEVSLDVKAPQAWLHITHDGTSQFGADVFLDHPLTSLGAEILVQPRNPGVVVDLALNSRRPIHSQHLVPERMRLIR